jgi:iron complex outermembrane recepter protein
MIRPARVAQKLRARNRFILEQRVLVVCRQGENTGMSGDIRQRLLSAAAMLSVMIISATQGDAARADNAQAAAPSTEEGGLETIVVTARKRTESVQDTPVDVTAVSGDLIRKEDLSSLEKLAEVTPDFEVGRASNGSGAQLTLRGIGSSSTSIGIEQSVAVVVDGVYYGQGRIIEEGFFDLAQLEVLKGPQALFFGKNATAGVISLTSADPTPDAQLTAKAAYEIESKTTQVEAVASGPITDTLGVRLSVRGSEMNGGYYRNEASDITYDTLDVATGTTTSHIASPASSDAPGEHELLTRGTLKWTPTDQLTGTLKLSSDYNYVNNSSWNYVAYDCPSGYGSLGPPNYPCGSQFVTHQNNMPTDIAQNFPYADGNGQLYNRYQSYAATGTFVYKTDEYNLTSVSNYQTNANSWACDCNFQSTSNGTWATENSTWYAVSEEFRGLTTFHFPVNFMLGGLAQKTMRNFNQWITFAGLSDSAAGPDDEYIATSKHSTTEGKTYSLFGQAIWQVIPTVEATAGLRYTHETKDSFFDQPVNNPALTGIFRPSNAALYGMVYANQLFTNVSPEATVSWKPVQDIMLYAAFKTGYKSGGFDNSGINSAAIAANPVTYMTFSPEKARGFEAGVKTTILENQLRINVEAFDYRYIDLQVDFFNSPVFDFQTVSADARTTGAELDLEYAPRDIHGLTLQAVINYNHARYTDFIGPCYAGETPAQGCNIPTPTLPFQNLTGATLGMAPKETGTAGARYDVPLGNAGWHLQSNLDARYSASYLASSFNNYASHIGGYVNLDAGLRLLTPNDKYEFAVVGKNLTDRFYVTGVVDGPSTGSGTGTAAGVPADQLGFGDLPRTIQFQVTGRFGL